MLPGIVPIWKKAPFLRLLIPLMTGIVLQWEFDLPIWMGWIVLCFSFSLLIAAFLLPRFTRFKWPFLNGVAITIIFLSLGSLLIWYKNISHDPEWFGNFYQKSNSVFIRLTEDPVEKKNSFKATATVISLAEKNQVVSTSGEIIVYFKKDSFINQLSEGTGIIFSRSLQEIKNAANPGGFNYKRYTLFQGITHQVYLSPGDFVVVDKKHPPFLSTFLQSIRENTVAIIRKNIPGTKEAGLAEALLIGYKDDLDKDLVQSYTNTGVVHIIAISGLHLGLIYWLLITMLQPLRKKRKWKWLSALIVVAALWIFSLVAGAQASVVRSAVMFTCIVLGDMLSRRSSIYNTLALSAFILLCYNPFWLWDVGFQLSYTAVLSIVIFMQPVYNWFFLKNKLLDLIWKMNAVSIAAQLLTTPLSLYHFHQFPNFFLLTNFVAVPLSSIIVLGEIFLCAISWLPALATIAGKILCWLIALMNDYIVRIERLPFSVWEGLEITILQVISIFLFISGFSFWFIGKSKPGLWLGLFSLTCFTGMRSFSFYKKGYQQQLIVYNVPNHQAIDIIIGRKYFFIGDSLLVANDFISNFHLKPSRVLYRIEPTNQPDGFYLKNNCLQLGKHHIMIIGNNDNSFIPSDYIEIDLLVISKSPGLNLSELFQSYNVKQVVFDGSNSMWKINSWIKDCNSRGVPYHNTSEKGAFVMTID